ncbi:centrosomal protein of 162 kDa isoform X2 [Halyomorpha halys]|uniref:centrosomal protein of 162 kDa isoform X2 n=1 Tax=Halyomorpha halys TaxID=286706 RepID=UPI0034D31BDC
MIFKLNDDIEGILHEISEILAAQSADNSQCTDNGLDDSRSVEEILKDAEELVCSAASHIEEEKSPVPNSTKNLCSNKSSKDKVSRKIATSVSFSEDSKQRSAVTDKSQNKPTDVQIKRSKSFSDFEKTKILDDGIKLDRAVFSPSRPYIRNDIRKNNKVIKKKSEVYELKLSDLATVYEDVDVPLETPASSSVKASDTTDNVVIMNEKVNTVEKQDNMASMVKDVNTTGTTENVALLKQEIESLNLKIAMYEKKDKDKSETADRLNIAEQNRLTLLKEEILSQEELIASYQRENQRLCSDIINTKEAWKETEMKLLEKARQNEQQKIAIMNKTNTEIMQLKEKLKVSEETIAILQLELKTIKEEKLEVEKMNEDLTVDITRLNCEIEEYKREMEDRRKSEKEKLLAIETNAAIQGKLSQANTEVTRKQTEIVRLNGMIGQLRGELEKIRLGSVINQSSENLTSTISQLQAALAIERDNSKELVKEKETMSKEVLDLKRQVKEMENILIKRSKSGSGLPIGEPYYPDSHRESYEQKNKALNAELSQSQAALAAKQQHLNELQSKYDQDIFKLEQELKKLRKESVVLKNSLEERDRGPKPVPAAKEDAHLLATIRGLKAEISNRDKDIVKLNKELDEIRKTNRRLQREREKALNAGNKYRSNGIHLSKDVDKNSRSDSDQSSSKDYNPVLYAEEQENILFLRSENRSLKEEIKKLEQDLISLHNKRIQDLSDLQEQHESEISRLMREHAAKHSSSTVAHLQGQLYTQQMVIHHLKEQIKMLEGSAEEVTVLKAERDHLESTLIEANKKIARFHDLQSPESMQYSELLDKLDFLERRHEVREQKLQAIVRDLLTKQGQGLTCSSNCRDKLLNKNREICYYRAEMDKILDTLAEFRWNK